MASTSKVAQFTFVWKIGCKYKNSMVTVRRRIQSERWHWPVLLLIGRLKGVFDFRRDGHAGNEKRMGQRADCSVQFPWRIRLPDAVTQVRDSTPKHPTQDPALDEFKCRLVLALAALRPLFLSQLGAWMNLDVEVKSTSGLQTRVAQGTRWPLSTRRRGGLGSVNPLSAGSRTRPVAPAHRANRTSPPLHDLAIFHPSVAGRLPLHPLASRGDPAECAEVGAAPDAVVGDEVAFGDHGLDSDLKVWELSPRPTHPPLYRSAPPGVFPIAVVGLT